MSVVGKIIMKDVRRNPFFYIIIISVWMFAWGVIVAGWYVDSVSCVVGEVVVHSGIF